MPAAVAFIEDDGVNREATVRVTVVLKGHPEPHIFVATVTHAVAFFVLHSTRDMSSNEVAVVMGKAGVVSFDLDQVASVFVDAGNVEGREQVLTMYEELTT